MFCATFGSGIDFHRQNDSSKLNSVFKIPWFGATTKVPLSWSWQGVPFFNPIIPCTACSWPLFVFVFLQYSCFIPRLRPGSDAEVFLTLIPYTLNWVREKFGVWINKERLFQSRTAQPFAFGATSERLFQTPNFSCTELACSWRSDRGDSAKRCEQRKKQQQQQQQRGGGEGVRARDSLFSPVFFSHSLPSRRTPLSERPGQASTEPNA